MLRWLLTEADQAAAAAGEMPSGVMSDSGALALHYAAARGCLDCVKMLIESPTLDFRYTIIVRVKWKTTNWAHLASGWE